MLNSLTHELQPDGSIKRKPVKKSRSKPRRKGKPTHTTKDGRLILSDADRTKQRKRLWAERSHYCEICCEPIYFIEDMELDHRIPKGLGGGTRDDRDDNQALTHIRCNRDKGSKRIGSSRRDSLLVPKS